MVFIYLAFPAEKAIISVNVLVCCRLPQLAVLAKILCLLMVSDIFYIKQCYNFNQKFF